MNKYIEHPYTEQYLIFGKFISVFSKYPSFLNELNEFLEPSHTEYATPHFELFTDLHHTHRYLFRTRPNDSDTGMKYMENDHLVEWNFQTPPFPPYESEIFSGKILALHGAAVMDKQRKVTLILGIKGSGKTTISSYLVNSKGMSFLTDETVIIASGTDFVYPFPRKILPREIEKGKIIKNAYPAKDFMANISYVGGLVENVVFLNPVEDCDHFEVNSLNVHKSMTKLMENFQYIGTNIFDGIESFHLLSTKSSKELTYRSGDFSELKKGIECLWPNMNN